MTKRKTMTDREFLRWIDLPSEDQKRHLGALKEATEMFLQLVPGGCHATVLERGDKCACLRCRAGEALLALER